MRGGGRAGPCPLVGVGCHGDIPFSTQWEAPLSLPRGWSRQPHRWLSASGTWQPSLWQPRAQQQGPVRKGGVRAPGRAACVCGGKGAKGEPPPTPNRHPGAQVEGHEGTEGEINSLGDKQLAQAAKTSQHAERQEDTWGQTRSWGEEQCVPHNIPGHTPSECGRLCTLPAPQARGDSRGPAACHTGGSRAIGKHR